MPDVKVSLWCLIHWKCAGGGVAGCVYVRVLAGWCWVQVGTFVASDLVHGLCGCVGVGMGGEGGGCGAAQVCWSMVAQDQELSVG